VQYILEGDSIQVVQTLKEKGTNRRTYGHIVNDVKFLLGTCRSWMAQHVRGDANQAAHGLAKEGLKRQMDRIWVNDLPECISNIVLLELNVLDM
jgi:hypothetical protein